jgi:hypothetical protein
MGKRGKAELMSVPGFKSSAGLPDFSCFNIPKRGKIYQITRKYTKWPENIPNGQKIYQTAVKYSK